MMTAAEENRLLLERIDADRRFLLLALQSNPKLLARAEESIRAWLTAVPPAPGFSSLIQMMPEDSLR